MYLSLPRCELNLMFARSLLGISLHICHDILALPCPWWNGVCKCPYVIFLGCILDTRVNIHCICSIIIAAFLYVLFYYSLWVARCQVLHHFLSLVSIVYSVNSGEGQLYTYMVLISEGTTPGINLRWYLI
mgnify:CR=1 FL=1